MGDKRTEQDPKPERKSQQKREPEELPLTETPEPGKPATRYG